MEPFSKVVLVELAKGYLEAHRGLCKKGNIFRSKLERSFLRNCSVFSEFISQSYIFPFKKPFAKAVPVELAKGYLEDIECSGEKGNISRLNWKESF